MSSPIVVIDNVRYRREDAEALGLIEVPEAEQVASIDPERFAAFEAWVAAGSPVVPPLDTDRHESLTPPVVVGGEAEHVEQGEITLPTTDGPAPAAPAADKAPEAEVKTETPADPAPLSTKPATTAAPRAKK